MKTCPLQEKSHLLRLQQNVAPPPSPAVHPPSDSQRAYLWRPPSLDGLLVGCAARVLGLHDVGELRGGGERLDPQLLERVI